MVNLFDLNSGIHSNKLGPHDDDSLHVRSRSDLGTTPRLQGTDDNLSNWNKKENRTPGRMLGKEDVSKNVELKNNRPNLVAKLMGLDSLPLHRSDPKIYARKFSQLKVENSSTRRKIEEEDRVSKKIIHRQMTQIRSKSVSDEFKDARENWQKSMEAKCPVTDENLRQSNEFQDALKLLSSNQDFFVRFLRQPNSLFLKNLYELYPVPTSPGTRRITVLRPSKTNNCKDLGRTSEESSKKLAPVEKTYSHSMTNEKDDEITPQLTRIVVLKPNNRKIHGIESLVSPPEIICGELCSNEFEDDKTEEFRRLAGEITDKIRTNLSGSLVNKISTTTVCSIGRSGDFSSANKSENEYAVEKSSNSEFMTPSSSSLSYVKNYDGTFRPSFSPTSCSNESPLSKEARKRLSERWAKISSNREAQERRGVRRNSNTLGEMLALSKAKKIEEVREKVFEKNDKSSLRGKVTGMFFSRNRKLSKEGDNTSYEDEILESSSHQRASRTFSGSISTSLESIKTRHHRDIVAREKGSAANLNLNSIPDPPFEFQQCTSSIIDKSPPIELIPRTLRHDGYCSCTSSSPSFQTTTIFTRKEDEKYFLRQVQTLLTMAGLKNNSSVLQWHSLETPLDPNLRDKYANLDGEERAHEARRRKLRSNQMLVFDSIVMVLREVTNYGSDWDIKTISNRRSRDMFVEISSLSMDRVLAKMKDWFNREVRFDVEEGEDSCSRVVESVVREKVVGREWVEHLKMEAENLRREMEERLMEEMVEEAVFDFANDIR